MPKKQLKNTMVLTPIIEILLIGAELDGHKLVVEYATKEIKKPEERKDHVKSLPGFVYI